MFREILKSSTGEGIMLRIKSLLILLIPWILGGLCTAQNLCLAPKEVLAWVDSLFVVFFGIVHAWGWIRSIK